MTKNLIISPTGNNSLVKEWMKGDNNFDIVLLCYENINDNKFFQNLTPHVFYGKGEKWHLIKSFAQENMDFIQQYQYIWCPDDDVSISTSKINELFLLAQSYDLWLCQPSMIGYISHEITKPIKNNILRYTNFVEILAPLFNINSFIKLKDTFNLIYSGWGYDWLWPYLLGEPKDKVAIIDNIIMEHTKPVGENYLPTRFPIPPHIEMDLLLQQYSINPSFINYSFIPKKS
jgi:hypothetical protein